MEQQPAHVNALINLTVLYEDAGDYEDAEHCLRQVLASDPNHPRARLFMREVKSSQQMFIDEDQERIREKRDAILDTPISDFELSVRSRNCLKKMNIFTLGDLLRISEAELLAYKNFGETSLTEIKAMLAQRGLRLGQLLEEQQSVARQKALETVTAAGAPEVLDKPVTELHLSVRSRKCLQRLNIETLGDLTSRTEAELLGAKNFGQTSLNEVKQRLTEYGLNLRQISG
ncbi:MAG TPA: DNA-directed RNA polymerase subunit alpha C-terminal domain-containing protein [Phycisphaerae bacterium]|nr:DNA-directed RNA polymerase subunit alpha C-terminal domain-containing protein [Phycisphaerae bacterium]